MKRSVIESLLPEVFQRTALPATPLSAMLEAMQVLHEPVEAALEKIDAAFDPRRTVDQMIPFLMRWVNFDRLFDESGAGRHTSGPFRAPTSTGLGHLRELVAISAYLTKWRGASKGLLLFLETATGEPGFEIDEQALDAKGHLKAFHILVRAPHATQRHKSLIGRIIELEKPAYVTYELEFKSPT